LRHAKGAAKLVERSLIVALRHLVKRGDEPREARSVRLACGLSLPTPQELDTLLLAATQDESPSGGRHQLEASIAVQAIAPLEDFLGEGDELIGIERVRNVGVREAHAGRGNEQSFSQTSS